MSFIGKVFGVILFNSKSIEDVTSDENATLEAIVILFLSNFVGSILEVLAYVKTGNTSSLGQFGAFVPNDVFSHYSIIKTVTSKV